MYNEFESLLLKSKGLQDLTKSHGLFWIASKWLQHISILPDQCKMSNISAQHVFNSIRLVQHIWILSDQCNKSEYHLISALYNDVIMSAMVSQITSLMIVYSTVYSRCRSKKPSKHRVTGLCKGNSPVTGEFPAQRTSNSENVSIWWCHHDIFLSSHHCNIFRMISATYPKSSMKI